MRPTLLLLICAAAFLTHSTVVDGHAFLTAPRSRQFQQRLANNEWCPHCYAAGGPGKTQVLGHGLCGDAADAAAPKYNPYTPAPTVEASNIYVQGGILEAEVLVATHHAGHVELRICDTADLADPTMLTQECLDAHLLERAEDPTAISPIDPAYPERFFLEPACVDRLGCPGGGVECSYGVKQRVKFQLPAGLTCEHCILQFYYWTANSCNPPGYREFDGWPTENDDCSGDGGAKGFFVRNGPSWDCGSPTAAYPEEFWNCADISIGASGAPTDPPTPRPPTTPPTTRPPTTATAPPTTTPPTPGRVTGDDDVQVLWGTCGGESWTGPTACEAGATCRRESQWYSQCVPGGGVAPTAGPAPTAAPAPTTPPTMAGGGGEFCAIDFAAGDGVLRANGERFRLKGANWFGFETTDNLLHGLWSVSMASLLDFTAANGFNALRIPLAVDTVLTDAAPQSLNAFENPDLVGKSMLEVLDVLVAEAARRGLLIMLDQHRLQAAGAITELWYDGAVTEADSVAMWEKLAARYCGAWNVVAADLKNEPHGAASWGESRPATDWNQAAERIGAAVQAACPRWLVFVEGVSGNVENVEAFFNSWWGGNIEGVATHPVVLPDNSKLVYSPHVYGPDVHMQPYFSVANFPDNMPAIWDKHYGFAAAATGNPVIIGEWGGFYEAGSLDRVWQDKIAAYLLDNEIDAFYWSLNPNSGDTGGLLHNDWKTPEADKLTMLAAFPHSDVAALARASCGGDSAPTAAPPTAAAPTAAPPTAVGVTYNWGSTSAWTPEACPTACGLPASTRTRTVFCTGSDGSVVGDAHCEGEGRPAKPFTELPCAATAACSAPPTAAPPTAAPPTAAAPTAAPPTAGTSGDCGYQMTFALTNSWTGGYTAEVRITGAAALGAWRVGGVAPSGAVKQAWNAVLSGDEFSSPSWSNPAATSAAFGFLGQESFTGAPTSFTVNGVACEAGAVALASKAEAAAMALEERIDMDGGAGEGGGDSMPVTVEVAAGVAGVAAIAVAAAFAVVRSRRRKLVAAADTAVAADDQC